MKNWFKENWFRLAALAVVFSIGLGYIFYLYTQESNRKEAEIRKEVQENLENVQKLEVENKKYLADRKSNCLVIYQTEGEKWNNVRSWRFDEEYDTCYIRYKDPEPKTEAQCDENYPIGEDWGLTFFGENLLCKDGDFEKGF